MAALFEHLPDIVKKNEHVRVYAGKDTYAAGRVENPDKPQSYHVV